jgi:CHAT domain-containing protein
MGGTIASPASKSPPIIGGTGGLSSPSVRVSSEAGVSSKGCTLAEGKGGESSSTETANLWGNSPLDFAGYYLERGVEEHRLPATAEEVRAVAALFPDAEVYLGAEANKERLRSLGLEGFRYLIFATHAYIDEESPMRSCVRLSAVGADGGYLRAQEIFRLSFDADLVALSACQSALGRLARGEGIVGLATAFFSAGARSLLASLWKVVDPATAALVPRFYAHLQREPVSRAEALRRAQRELIATSPEFAHPFFWAFSLMGDWATSPPGPESPGDTPPAASP